MPLTMLEQAAESAALPPHLRQGLAEIAWVRALGLNDTASIRRMSRLLPAPVRADAGESDGFPATLALLRAPGLRPFVQAGVQRSASFAEMDHWRDNWWCGRWNDGSPLPGNQRYGPEAVRVPELAFLSAEEKQRADEEASRLNELPEGLGWVGQRALAYVKAHPDDARAPETLALIVQGTRWGGCSYESPNPTTVLSKEAFMLLHHRYPNTEWARKTKYYY
jgi:hypothetical protein